MWPLGFIRDIISEKKWYSLMTNLISGIKMSDIEETHVPNSRELAVKRVIPELRVNEHFIKYMPDYPEKMLAEKAYFYLVSNSLYPNGTENLLKTWRQKRSIGIAEDKGEQLEETLEILYEINSLLLHPSNRRLDILLNWNYKIASQ